MRNVVERGKSERGREKKEEVEGKSLLLVSSTTVPLRLAHSDDAAVFSIRQKAHVIF